MGLLSFPSTALVLSTVLMGCSSYILENMADLQHMDGLYKRLNRSLAEIGQIDPANLTLDELSARLGLMVPEQHREVAIELADNKYRNDRPMHILLPLVKAANFDNGTAEEFQRAVLRSLLDKPFVMSPERPLRQGDVICICNSRECKTTFNELISSTYGREMGSFCRISKHGHCLTQKRLVDGHPVVDAGCAFDSPAPGAHHACRATLHSSRYCCQTALCNNGHILADESFVIGKPEELRSIGAFWRTSFIITIIVCVLLVAALLLLFCSVLPAVHRERLSKVPLCKHLVSLLSFDKDSLDSESGKPLVNNGESPLGSNHNGQPIPGRGLSSLLRDLDSTIGSGSGSGAPLLAQRTIARQIDLVEKIGCGRFGEVWRGSWRGDHVAVKIFSARDERSWTRELETFNTNMLRHTNLLRFIAADNKDTGLSTQLWLVTEYHPNGSLYDYMSKNEIGERTYMIMMKSVATGLAYLHAEIPGMSSKPGIAHRDLKTGNILVKQDLSCVIADFGLAVKYERGVMDMPDNNKSGTIRYLAPEILSDEMPCMNEFEQIRNGDLYAFALIMWEVGKRVSGDFDGVVIERAEMDEALAYHDMVPRDPSYDDMKQVVWTDEKRPAIPEFWKENKIFVEMSRLMRECWSRNPNARLSALNVRISIDRLAQSLGIPMPDGFS